MRQRILELSYDPIAKAMYIMLKDIKVAKTIRPTQDLSLDLDADGNLVGIEVISVKKPKLVTRQIKNVAEEYHMPELKKVHLEKLQEVYG